MGDTLTVKITGNPGGGVSAKAFVVVLDSTLGILRNIDADLSGKVRGTLDWFVTNMTYDASGDLHTVSLGITGRPRQSKRKPRKRIGEEAPPLALGEGK